VQTPLGFFVLVVLIIEVAIGVLTASSAVSNHAVLIVVMLAVLVLLVPIMAGMGIWRPAALRGTTAAPTRNRNLGLIELLTHWLNLSETCCAISGGQPDS